MKSFDDTLEAVLKRPAEERADLAMALLSSLTMKGVQARGEDALEFQRRSYRNRLLSQNAERGVPNYRDQLEEPEDKSRTSPVPFVHLYSAGFGLLVPWPSGLLYGNQTGGYWCNNPAVESVFIPLWDRAEEPEGPEADLYAYFTGPKHLGYCTTFHESDASEVERILDAHRLGGLMEVDRTRLAESHEAWVHVAVLRDAPHGPWSDLGPYPRPGILTWGNSD